MDTIKKLIAEVLRLPQERINDGLEMKNTAEWDSLKHIELIVALEQQLNIELSGDEIAQMTSYRAICDILKTRGL